MLQELHQVYRETLRRSDWFIRFEILYLGLVPVFLVGAICYGIWLYLHL